MTNYKTMVLADFSNLARASNPELGAIGASLVDYFTGKTVAKFDNHEGEGAEDTALFLASAREMVLELVYRVARENCPPVVCLCGSTRFSEAFQQANLRETLAGKIVLTIGCDMRSDGDLFAGMTEDELAEIKRRLDELHLRKIDMADEILVLNVNGYVGDSTRREVEYARAHNKAIRWLESIERE